MHLGFFFLSKDVPQVGNHRSKRCPKLVITGQRGALVVINRPKRRPKLILAGQRGVPSWHWQAKKMPKIGIGRPKICAPSWY